MIKKLFGKKNAEPPTKDLTIEDLIVLERWDEAIGYLEARIENSPNDLHAHLRLAEVFVQSGKPARAVDRFVFVADSYTDDGFYDKAIALLSKVARLAPSDSSIESHLRRARQFKDLEHRRGLALEGLTAAEKEKDLTVRLSLVEAQSIWAALAPTDVVLRLPGEQLKRLFEFSKILDVPEGTYLADRGNAAEVAFLIVRGEVEAVIDLGAGRPVQVRTFAVGDIIGDRALLEHQSWPASYRTTAACRLFRLDPAGLEKALEGNPDPRQLLDALRARRHDHDVAASVRKLVNSSG